MRSVTVRVHQDGDWHFRAERTDGQPLFEVEFGETGSASAPTKPAPAAAPEAPAPSLIALLDDEAYQRSLDEALKALGKNMPPGPPFTRVLEIGGFLGEMTKRLHRLTDGERPEPVYMVDPFISRRDELARFLVPENMPELRRLLTQNVQTISPRFIEGTEQQAADSLAPMGIDLLCLSAAIDPEAFAVLLNNWHPHLSPSGVILSRRPKDITPNEVGALLTELRLDFIGLTEHWFMAVRKEAAK